MGTRIAGGNSGLPHCAVGEGGGSAGSGAQGGGTRGLGQRISRRRLVTLLEQVMHGSKYLPFRRIGNTTHTTRSQSTKETVILKRFIYTNASSTMTRRRHEASSLEGCTCVSDRGLDESHWACTDIDAGATSAHPRTLSVRRGFRSLGTWAGLSMRCRRQAQLTVDGIDRISCNSHRRRWQNRRRASGDAGCKETRREKRRIRRHCKRVEGTIRASSTFDFHFKSSPLHNRDGPRRCHVF